MFNEAIDIVGWGGAGQFGGGVATGSRRRALAAAEAAARESEQRMSQDVPLCPNGASAELPILPPETGDDLSPTQRVAIAALIAGKTFAMAARYASVDRRTLYRWRQLPAFRRVMDEVSREALETTATRIRNLMLRATRVLSEGMTGSDAFGCAIRVANSTRLWKALESAEHKLDEREATQLDVVDTDPAIAEGTATAAAAQG